VTIGRKALVTGAGTGIGKAIALALAVDGFHVLAAGRRLEPLQKLAEALGEAACSYAQVDVGDPVGVKALAERWSDVDVLINNAGSDVGGRRPFIEGDIEDWANTIRTNVTGVINFCAAFAPNMVARRKGTIVNIGSSVVHRSYAGSAVYAASKSAVHMFSDCLRAELHRTGVRVIEMQPGVASTDFDLVRTKDSNAAAAFYEGFDGVLELDDIVRAVMFAINQPARVTISQMTVLPPSDW